MIKTSKSANCNDVHDDDDDDSLKRILSHSPYENSKNSPKGICIILNDLKF
jgi:hypothetical protein